MTKLTAPTGLGTKAKRIWADITSSYELRSDERRILEDACREVDLVERLEREFRDEPTMVKGSMGQLVASPILQELRQHRALVATLLAKLKLPDEDGRGAESASDKARRAANTRWGRGA